MGSQRRGAHRDRQFPAHAARSGQTARLVFGAQAVAGLDLERGHTFAHQHLRARCRAGKQRLVAGGARGGHGAANAATGACDVFVAGALQALLEFSGAVAAVHQVGVCVHQAGRYQRTFQVVFGLRCQAQLRAAGQVGVAAQPANLAAGGEQRAAVDQAPAAAAGKGGQACVAPQGQGLVHARLKGERV